MCHIDKGLLGVDISSFPYGAWNIPYGAELIEVTPDTSRHLTYDNYPPKECPECDRGKIEVGEIVKGRAVATGEEVEVEIKREKKCGLCEGTGVIYVMRGLMPIISWDEMAGKV